MKGSVSTIYGAGANGGCTVWPSKEFANDVRLFVLAEQRFRDLVQQREGNNNGNM